MPVMAPVKPRSLLKTKTHYLQQDDLRSLLEPADPNKKTVAGAKVIVTLGPATHNVDTLCELLEAGMSCARIDLTFGTPEYHEQSLANLEEARKRTGITCAVMVDTLGRELVVRRTFKLDASGWPETETDLEIREGQTVTLTTDKSASASSSQLPVNFSRLPSFVQPGDGMFVGTYLNTGSDNSSLFLEVVNVGPAEVDCIAKNSASLGGLLTLVHSTEANSGFSPVQSELPLLSEDDVAGLKLLQGKHAIDYVAVSYARSADDLWEMRQFLDKAGMHNTKMICKLEDRQSLCNFQALSSMADGIIFARGNLGLDVPAEKMAMVQKHVISECNQLGKPVIITRIVDTMVNTPRPTRAEATDVANAILDGADGLLLGAETLRGKYPVITVTTVLDICREAEAAFDHAHHYEVLISEVVKLDGGMRRGSEADLQGMVASGQAGSAHSLQKLAQQAAGGGGGLARTSSADLARMGGNVSSFGSIHKSLSHLSLASNKSADSAGEDGGDGGKVAAPPTISAYKLEALTSSAVRAVAKVQARLLICFGTTGRTASLLAKYRPPVPVLTVVMHKAYAGDTQHAAHLSRQLNLVRGIIPLLAHPEAEENQEMMQWAVQQALARQLIAPGDQVVCIMAIQDNMVLKMVCVNDDGSGLAKVGSTPSLAHMGSEDMSQYAQVPCKVGSLP